jgi:hypothetical protein
MVDYNELMPGCANRSIRWSTLLLMALVLVVSSNRVLHAHADGDRPHRLDAQQDCSLCQVSAIAWHAHVHLFGIEVHVPVADEDDLDPHRLPGDICPSWSDLPTSADAFQIALPLVEAGLERWIETLPAAIDFVAPELTRSQHSGLSPGYLQRIVLESLTL